MIEKQKEKDEKGREYKKEITTTHDQKKAKYSLFYRTEDQITNNPLEHKNPEPTSAKGVHFFC
jgi:hypothetical protein